MPSIKRRKKPKTRKIFHKYINQQDGGIKVMIGRTDDASDPNNNPLTQRPPGGQAVHDSGPTL